MYIYFYFIGLGKLKLSSSKTQWLVNIMINTVIGKDHHKQLLEDHKHSCILVKIIIYTVVVVVFNILVPSYF